eukprot:TRINITY_DN18286_c0_g1_i1.p1 TRINITY_DN18286_c0_g1~~TRINITY_DN18286_c0_g1_i1.p1  ORF type:complete len:542 (-),score=112.85 TRINITY_DN18286_c0_g1_i1:239-1864(-)
MLRAAKLAFLSQEEASFCPAPVAAPRPGWGACLSDLDLIASRCNPRRPALRSSFLQHETGVKQLEVRRLTVFTQSGHEQGGAAAKHPAHPQAPVQPPEHSGHPHAPHQPAEVTAAAHAAGGVAANNEHHGSATAGTHKTAIEKSADATQHHKPEEVTDGESEEKKGPPSSLLKELEIFDGKRLTLTCQDGERLPGEWTGKLVKCEADACKNSEHKGTALVLMTEQGQCLSSGADGDGLTEECPNNDMSPDCSSNEECNMCLIVRAGQHHSAKTSAGAQPHQGFELATACHGSDQSKMQRLSMQDGRPKFKVVELGAGKTHKKQCQNWSIKMVDEKDGAAAADTDSQGLVPDLTKQAFMLRSVSGTGRALLHEAPPSALESNTMGEFLASPNASAELPPSNTSMHAELHMEQWRRAWWKGLKHKDGLFIQGVMMSPDHHHEPAMNFLSAAPTEGSAAPHLAHFRAEATDLADCEHRWKLEPAGDPEGHWRLRTDCSEPEARYLTAENGGVGLTSEEPGREGYWQIKFQDQKVEGPEQVPAFD